MESVMEKNCILFAGNPGGGKSTLLNSLLGKPAFASGISVARGKTYQLDSQTFGGVTYLDTPGLDDVEMRKQAGEAINCALKQNGKYRIFFVCTEESGRLRGVDLATMKLILNAVTTVQPKVNIILNKLTPTIYNRLNEVEARIFTIKTIQNACPQISNEDVLFLKAHPDLSDADDAFASLPELRDFVEGAQCTIIKPAMVRGIRVEEYDNVAEHMERLMKDLRQTPPPKITKYKDGRAFLRECMQKFQDIQSQAHITVDTELHDIQKPTLMIYSQRLYALVEYITHVTNVWEKKYESRLENASTSTGTGIGLTGASLILFPEPVITTAIGALMILGGLTWGALPKTHGGTLRDLLQLRTQVIAEHSRVAEYLSNTSSQV